MFESSDLRVKWFAPRTIPDVKFSGRFISVRSTTTVVIPSVVSHDRHPRIHVLQMEKETSDAHGDRVGGIQAKEPHTRFVSSLNVSPNVQFWKSGEPWESRHTPGCNVGHSKRHDADPRLAIECIQGQALGKMHRDIRLGDRPMHE